ncbi:hypothetical protein ACX9NE_22270 [Mycobacterium sp. ML4]
MTLLERATKSVNSVADETVATVSQLGRAIADGVVITANDIRDGIRERRIRPRPVVAAAAIGLVAAAEWPVVLAVGGASVLVNKLKSQSAEAGDGDVPDSPKQ